MISTKIVKLDPLNPDVALLKEAGDILRKGGLVVIPTETVYGIAANMLNKQTINRLYEIKARPKDKPFSLIIDRKDRIEEFAKDIPLAAYKLIDKFWPGPLTLILRAKTNSTVGTSTLLSADGERSRTVGIRMPDHEIALRIISIANVPLVCPSANISGKPAPITFQEAIKDLNGRVDFAIDAGEVELKLESTIVDATAEPLGILREGAIKKEDIEAAVKKKIVLFICTGNSCRSVMAKGYLEKKLREINRNDVEVLSAGIAMLGGIGATFETIELLKSEGVDVSVHRSQRVTKEMLNKSDIVLVMEKLQEERILQFAPQAKNKLFLLKEFAKINSNNLNIADPIGRPIEFYEQTFRIIKEAVEKIIQII